MKYQYKEMPESMKGAYGNQHRARKRCDWQNV